MFFFLINLGSHHIRLNCTGTDIEQIQPKRIFLILPKSLFDSLIANFCDCNSRNLIRFKSASTFNNLQTHLAVSICL